MQFKLTKESCFLKKLFGELPNLFKSEQELRSLWGNPNTRKALLDKLEDAGFPKSDLRAIQKLVNMQNSDLFDVLEYVSNGDYEAITRQQRADISKSSIFDSLDDNQQEFIEFVLGKYVRFGIDELESEKLPILLKSKYRSIEDAKDVLGNPMDIKNLFTNFQQHLYQQDFSAEQQGLLSDVHGF